MDSAATTATTWRAVRAALSRRPLAEFDAAELDMLADALFWTDDVGESIDVRRRSYRAHADAGDDAAAAMAAWRLFYDHFLVGEMAIANGWIERCRHHVSEGDRSPEAGWIHVALADVAASNGDEPARLAHARTATSIGRMSGDANLLAMALQAEGQALIADDDQSAGVTLLDEAMVAVTNGELDALYTGWVFCNVVSVCYQLADLERAGQWSRAALRWCETLTDGQMYPGLCRVYAVELDSLHGRWSHAETLATRACAELTAFDPRYAGEAFYLVGELRRLRGDLDAAAEAYQRAHELGRVPQPGLALSLAARGRVADAVAALRRALPSSSPLPLPRAQLLSELIALEVVLADVDAARGHVTELQHLANASGAPVIDALATGAAGRLHAAMGDHFTGYQHLHVGAERLSSLHLPYEAARLRLAASRAAVAGGDRETARLDAAAARSAFARLGAGPDEAAASAWLDDLRLPPRPADTVLSVREREVLRHLVTGCTNRDIADRLHVSPHTVGRHVSNIFAKLGVSSRAAATAHAYEHGLVDADV